MSPASSTGHHYSRSSPTQSHTGRVVQALGQSIVAGRYAERAILPGDSVLMAEFGVSRTVLREALRTLSGKGLLQARARVGTMVRDQSEWHLFDPDVLIWHAQAGFSRDFLAALGEMRLVIEPQAAALAADRRTEQQLAGLRACVERMAAPDIGKQEFVAADLDFHLAVVDAAANPFLGAVSTLIEVALVAALSRSWPGSDPSGTARSAARHRAIADAIGCRDGAAAAAAMRAVINDGIWRAAHAALPVAVPSASPARGRA